MHIQYNDLYCHVLSIRTLTLGVLKVTILADPSLDHHYYTLSLSELYSGVEKILLRNTLIFTLFTPKLPPLWVGVMKFTISCLLTLEVLHKGQRFSSSWEGNINALRMMPDDGHQLIAIGHLKHCSNLKSRPNSKLRSKWLARFKVSSRMTDETKTICPLIFGNKNIWFTWYAKDCLNSGFLTLW